MTRIQRHDKFEGVYWIELDDGTKYLGTKNIARGVRVYDEKLIDYGGDEYRTWNAYKSKLAGAILKGLKEMPVKEGQKILYLGTSTGTTASHISDIVGEKGIIYGVEFAARVMREFLERCVKYRVNLIPILADARDPRSYLDYVEEVDLIYADVAQPEQAKILADNSDFFLRSEGKALLAIKASSIDVTLEPTEVFRREMIILEKRGFKVLQMLHLEPYDKDHAMVYLEKET
ncbi:MAG TPA: fibrillarin-like rRNA/tRNA 2'-O-methyltransferase [Geobacterales bacterium]|nr:fibrillarin-like rRNA/tRNA 2'-O-methyltransferase [Geobacterales bacterium]